MNMGVKTAVSLTLIFLALGLSSGCQQNNREPEQTISAPLPATPADTITAYPVPATMTPDHAYPYPAPATTTPDHTYPGGVRPSPLPVSPTPTVDCITGNDLNVSLTRQFDPFTALLVLYGEGCIDNENRSVILNDESGNQWIISPIIAVPYEESSVSKMIFLAQKTKSAWMGLCHPCGAVVGGFLLSWENGNWQVVSQKELFREGLGSFGYAPPAALIQLGPNKLGVIFREFYTSTGYTNEEIHILAPWQDELVVVAYFYDIGLREITNNSWGYTSSLEMVRGSHPEFDDIRLVTTGTKWIVDGIRPFSETKIYVFRNGQYQIQE